MSVTAEEKVQKQEKPLDGVFPDKWSLENVLELLQEKLPGHRVPRDKVKKVLDFIKDNISLEDLPDKVPWTPQF